MQNTITKSQALDYLYNNSAISETGCREWTGPVTKDGYGQIGPEWIVRTYKIKGAHRLMVHLVHGHEFAGRHEQVMHRCHNRGCVNPEHLEVGDCSTNMQASAARGTLAKKLCERDVREIRALAGTEKTRNIAKQYGVHTRTVHKVVNRSIWKHVPQVQS